MLHRIPEQAWKRQHLKGLVRQRLPGAGWEQLGFSRWLKGLHHPRPEFSRNV
jgi:hypothetical protein